MFNKKHTIYDVFKIDENEEPLVKYNELFKAMEYNDRFEIDACPFNIYYVPACMDRLLKKYDNLEQQMNDKKYVKSEREDIKDDLKRAGVTYISENDLLGIMQTAIHRDLDSISEADLEFRSLEILSYIGYIDFKTPILQRFQDDVLKNGFLASSFVADRTKEFLTSDETQKFYHFDVYDLDNYFHLTGKEKTETTIERD